MIHVSESREIYGVYGYCCTIIFHGLTYVSPRQIHEIHIIHKLDDLTHVCIELYESTEIREHIFLCTCFEICSGDFPFYVHDIFLEYKLIFISCFLYELNNSIHECRSDNHTTTYRIVAFHIKKFFKFYIFEFYTIGVYAFISEKIYPISYRKS